MTTLTQQAVRAVPTPQIVLPLAPRASQAAQAKPRHQQRVPRDRRRQLATEEPLPVYTPAPSGPPSSQSHPLSSQLLSSAQIEREGISWLLLQGWEGYDSLMHFGNALQTGNRRSITCSRSLTLPSHGCLSHVPVLSHSLSCATVSTALTCVYSCVILPYAIADRGHEEVTNV